MGTGEHEREPGAPAHRGLMTVDTTCRAANEALRSGDADWAFKIIVQGRDHLRVALASRCGIPARWAHRTTPIEDIRYDALLRALVAHDCVEHGRMPPAWAIGARLSRPWVLVNPFLGEAATRGQTPPWLAEAGIYIAARDLETA